MPLLLDYIIWAPDPVIFTIAGFELRWYSLLFALGFVLSYVLLKKDFSRRGLPPEKLDKLTIYVVLATVIGARLAHCFFYDWDYYSDHLLEIILPVKFSPDFQFTGFRGLASHGGILGVAIAIWLFSRRHKVDALWLYDRLAIVGALAGTCIRLGNLMNSEIIGKPAEVPWAFVFTYVDTIPRHPGQLYEALAYLGIFVILTLTDRMSRRKPGFLFGLFFALLFTARFFIEFVKADQADFEAGMLLNMGQLLSIPFIIFGLIFMYLKKARRDDPRAR